MRGGERESKKARERDFIMVHSPDDLNGQGCSRQNQESGVSPCHMVASVHTLGTVSTAFSRPLALEAGSEVNQLGLEMMPIQAAGVVSGGFACCATMIKQCYACAIMLQLYYF